MYKKNKVHTIKIVDIKDRFCRFLSMRNFCLFFIFYIILPFSWKRKVRAHIKKFLCNLTIILLYSEKMKKRVGSVRDNLSRQ